MRVILVALILLAPLASAAWTHDHGDAGRAGAAQTPDLPWAATSTTQLPVAQGRHSWFADGPALVGAALTDGTCRTYRHDATGSTTTGAIPDCQAVRAQARVDGDLLVCLERAGGSVARVEVDGTTTWRTGLVDVLAGVTGSWRCDGAAVDASRGIAYVPFWQPTGPGHVLVALRTSDGTFVWNTTTDAPGTAGFEPSAVTVTAGGLVVAGTVPCHQTPDCGAIDRSTPVAALLFFDRDGSLIDRAYPTGGRADGSDFAAARGAAAWARLGADAITVDPLQGEPQRLRIDAASRPPSDAWPASGPVVQGASLLYPVHAEVIQVDATTMQRGWTWPGLPGGWVQEGIATANGSAWLVWQGDTPTLVVLREGGDVRQQVPLPLSTDGPGRASGIVLVPTGTGLAAIDAHGAIAWLAHSPHGPSPDTYYPAADEAAVFRMDGAERIILALPDGSIRSTAGPSAEITLAGAAPVQATAVFADGTTAARFAHIRPATTPAADPETAFPDITVSTLYPAPGATAEIATDGGVNELWLIGPSQTLRARAADGPVALSWSHSAAGEVAVQLLAVLDDGRVAGTTLTFAVGGTPSSPGLLDRAFAPENQDMTWGIIGVSVALIGGAIGIAAQQRRRRRIRKHLDRIDAVRGLTRADPMAALRELSGERRNARDLHTKGAIDDAQYHVLKARCQEVMRRIIVLTVDPLRGDLPADFNRRFDAAVEDGALDDAEAEDLMRLLGAAPGPANEVMQRFLEAWRAG